IDVYSNVVTVVDVEIDSSRFLIFYVYMSLTPLLLSLPIKLSFCGGFNLIEAKCMELKLSASWRGKLLDFQP
ncbi:hypothetical protein Tco_0230696, partial [Tanacetum coccineum]